VCFCFHLLDHVKVRNLWKPIEKLTNYERFQNIVSEFISPRQEINTGTEADKAARDFTASIAAAHRLSTRKVALSDVNSELPGLDRLFKLKRRLRKLWQETRDPICKTAVNWATKSMRRLTSRKVLERWEAKIANTEVTKRDGPKTPTAIHGSLGFTFHPLEKANAIADCLEKQFTSHELCVENHKRRVEATVQAVLETVDSNPHERILPCDLQKLINALKLKKG
jgi:hypothetical protein